MKISRKLKQAKSRGTKKKTPHVYKNMEEFYAAFPNLRGITWFDASKEQRELIRSIFE